MVHTVELLDWAGGGPRPAGLGDGPHRITIRLRECFVSLVVMKARTTPTVWGTIPPCGGLLATRPSYDCIRDAVLFVVERWYGFAEFEGYLGDVGLVVSKLAGLNPYKGRSKENSYLRATGYG